MLEELGRTDEAERWYGYADAAVAALQDAAPDEDEDELIEIEDLEGDEPADDQPETESKTEEPA